MAISNPFEEINSRLDRLEKLLIEITEKEALSQNSNDGDQWFDLKGLIEYLPSHPRPQTVYEWVYNKVIPFHKPEGTKTLKFLRSEVDQWLKTSRRKTQSEKDELVKKYLNNKTK